MTPQEKYPELMAFITERSNEAEMTAWNTLRLDEAAAVRGEYAQVAQQLENAQSDYTVAQLARGKSGFPYNSAISIFLGLPLRSNNEPPRGYYFASQVTRYFRFGVAKREVESLLADGANLKIVAARDKATGMPIRFTTYKAHQIHIEGNAIVCRNDKKSVRLSSTWSIETAMQKVADALRTGKHYGDDRAQDDGPSQAIKAVIPLLRQ